MQIVKFYILLSLFLGILCSSCINEIDFDELQTAPMITVNCLATPDTILRLNLNLTKFFLSTAPGFETVTDRVVKLYVNDKFKETLLIRNNQYQSKYKPKTGEHLRLEIFNPGADTLLAITSTVIPPKPELLDVDTSSVYNSSSYLVNDSAVDISGKVYNDTLARIVNLRINYEVQFRDSLLMSNFYRIKIFIFHYYEDGKISRETLRLRPDDIIFDRKNETDIFDNDRDKIFNIFNDELIDGKIYSVKLYGNLNKVSILPGKKEILRAAGYKFPVRSELVIDLQAIDKHFFQYLKTVKYNNTDLQYFSEPVQVYSNIAGGTGLFGSYSHAYYTIPLTTNGNIFYLR
jgi:hypothetical protein